MIIYQNGKQLYLIVLHTIDNNSKKTPCKITEYCPQFHKAVIYQCLFQNSFFLRPSLYIVKINHNGLLFRYFLCQFQSIWVTSIIC